MQARLEELLEEAREQDQQVLLGLCCRVTSLTALMLASIRGGFSGGVLVYTSQPRNDCQLRFVNRGMKRWDN